MFLPVFTLYIHSPRMQKSEKYVLEGFGPVIYLFPQCADPFLGAMRDHQGAGECTLWGVYCTMYEQLGHALVFK